jgi:hypothetical protein
MAESAALLVDEVFPERPVRQWVLSVPYPLRFLFACRPEVMGLVFGIVYRCLAGDAFEAGPMEQLLGSSITYRIPVGP